jgi:hypothetical protein
MISSGVSRGTSQNPSATAVASGGGKIIVSYLASDNPINDDKLTSGIEKTLRSRSVEFDGTAFSNNIGATDQSEANSRIGSPKIVEVNGQTYMFFDKGTEDGYDNPETFGSRIAYKRYVNGQWEAYSQDPFLSLGPDVPENSIQPAPVVVNGKLLLMFSKFNKPEGKAGTWDILTSVQKEDVKEFSLAGIEISTDKAAYAPGSEVKVSGKLRYDSAAPADRKVVIQFNSYFSFTGTPDQDDVPSLVLTEDRFEVLADDTGAFELLHDGFDSKAYYSVNAEHGGKKSSYAVFKVE